MYIVYTHNTIKIATWAVFIFYLDMAEIRYLPSVYYDW